MNTQLNKVKIAACFMVGGRRNALKHLQDVKQHIRKDLFLSFSDHW